MHVLLDSELSEASSFSAFTPSMFLQVIWRVVAIGRDSDQSGVIWLFRGEWRWWCSTKLHSFSWHHYNACQNRLPVLLLEQLLDGSTVCGKKYPPKIFLQFSQQLLRIWKRNFTNLFSHPMQTYQYYHYSISLMYANVILITVTSPSDLSLLKNFCTKIQSWKSHIKLAVKQLSGFQCQRNKAFKFTRIEPLDYYVWENIIIWGHSQVPFKPRISTCFKLV